MTFIPNTRPHPPHNTHALAHHSTTLPSMHLRPTLRRAHTIQRQSQTWNPKPNPFFRHERDQLSRTRFSDFFCRPLGTVPRLRPRPPTNARHLELPARPHPRPRPRASIEHPDLHVLNPVLPRTLNTQIPIHGSVLPRTLGTQISLPVPIYRRIYP